MTALLSTVCKASARRGGVSQMRSEIGREVAFPESKNAAGSLRRSSTQWT
ncbi:MAG: hypothetical protein RL136_2269 [Planctomycetota bacterium]|jgi:hypothetical protein